MNNKREPLRLLDARGLAAIPEAADAVLQPAADGLAGKGPLGAAYFNVSIDEDVAAVDASSEAAGKLGKIIATQVIACVMAICRTMCQSRSTGDVHRRCVNRVSRSKSQCSHVRNRHALRCSAYAKLVPEILHHPPLVVPVC